MKWSSPSFHRLISYIFMINLPTFVHATCDKKNPKHPKCSRWLVLWSAYPQTGKCQGVMRVKKVGQLKIRASRWSILSEGQSQLWFPPIPVWNTRLLLVEKRFDDSCSGRINPPFWGDEWEGVGLGVGTVMPLFRKQCLGNLPPFPFIAKWRLMVKGYPLYFLFSR